jgi:hypothetical protein
MRPRPRRPVLEKIRMSASGGSPWARSTTRSPPTYTAISDCLEMRVVRADHFPASRVVASDRRAEDQAARWHACAGGDKDVFDLVYLVA